MTSVNHQTVSPIEEYHYENGLIKPYGDGEQFFNTKFRVVGKHASFSKGMSRRFYDFYFFNFIHGTKYGVVADHVFEEALVQSSDAPLHRAYLPTIMDNKIIPSRLEKYNPTVQGNMNNYNVCLEQIVHWFRSDMRRTKMLSVESVLSYIDLTKSPGRLWKVFGKTKRDVLEHEVGRSLLFDTIHFLLDDEKNCLCYWNVLLKDELRQYEKVVEGKTRVFTASDFAWLVFTNIVCLDFNLKFYDANLLFGSTVGVGKYHNAFHEFSKMFIFGNITAGDWGDWDGKMREFELSANAEIRQACFEDPSDYSKACLSKVYEGISNGVFVLPEGQILTYESEEIFDSHPSLFPITSKRGRQTSGGANTIVDNTMTHLLRLFWCWVDLSPREIQSLMFFRKNIVFLLCGDDNLIDVHPDVVRFFNPTTITLWALDHGWTIEMIGLQRTLEGVVFLGHAFRKEGHSYVPVLSFERLFCSMLRGAPSKTSPQYSYDRACNLRIEGFFNHHWRDLIDRYMNYLVQKYPSIDTSGNLSPSTVEVLYGVELVKK